jgi:dihydrofolate reductase
MAKPLNLIVACAENRIIGRDTRLPFDVPEDKRWFHDRTAGSIVLLGRICFEVWPQVLRDGRRAVVLSSDPARIRASAERRFGTAALRDLHICADLPSALATAQGLPGEIMICGGQRIYEETLPQADRLLLTLVQGEFAGDTWFPEWRHLAWRESFGRDVADANHRYRISILDRVR